MVLVAGSWMRVKRGAKGGRGYGSCSSWSACGRDSEAGFGDESVSGSGSCGAGCWGGGCEATVGAVGRAGVGLGVELAAGVIEEESAGGRSMGNVSAGIGPASGDDAASSSLRLSGVGVAG